MAAGDDNQPWQAVPQLWVSSLGLSAKGGLHLGAKSRESLGLKIVVLRSVTRRFVWCDDRDQCRGFWTRFLHSWWHKGEE